MTDIFKDKLKTLRNPPEAKTFAQALFGEVHWIIKEHPVTPVPEITTTEFSEKKQILDSLERFAQEKIEQSPQHKIIVDGGEILQKAQPQWQGISAATHLEELKSSLNGESETLSIILDEKQEQDIRVIFVPEVFRSYSEFSSELQAGKPEINQLLPFFPLKTAELFSRMIAAMKLSSKEVLVYASMNQEKDSSEEVMKVCAFFKPEVIVTLGAASTQKILKSQERLTQVHGQFFHRVIEGVGDFTIVPLFHPSIIETNLNMKKAAWTDMQKIMEFLKLL